MAQAQEIDIAEELASVESALEALLSGREGALESGAWRAAVRAVFALCSVTPSHYRLLLEQIGEILRRHLNSVKKGILNPTTAALDSATAAPDSATAAPDSATAAPDSATAAPESANATLSRVSANLRLNLTPIFKNTKPHANCKAPKALLQRYATAWETFLKTIKKMEPMYMHLNLKLKTELKERDLNNDSIFACEKRDAHYACSATYSSVPKDLKEYLLFRWLEWVMYPVGRAVRRAVTRALRSECDGRPFIDRAVLKSVIDSFREVREYDTIDKDAMHREWVVQPYLAAARVQHAKRAKTLLAKGDLSQFMSHMLAVNVHELSTLMPYFGQPICRQVQINFQEAVVVPHVRRLQDAAPAFVSAAAGGPFSTARHDLRHLFLLLRMVRALPPLLDAARAQVIADGRALLARKEHHTEMHDHFVNTIMADRQKYWLLFEDVFESEKLLCQDVLNKALRVLVNGDIPVAAADRSGGAAGGTTWRAPELLARYCDAQLRRRPDEFMQSRIAAVLLIFMSLDEKVVFQDTYQKMLARRLLNHSSSLVLEEMFITKFRRAGTEFNGKLRAMCTDMAASLVLNEKFREWTEEKREPFSWGGDEDCREHSVQVLQGWAWPLVSVPTPWVAPAPLESYTKKFEAFYKERHPRRRLAWLHELCTGELALRYAARPYELAATGAQCGLLLAFQERKRWGAEELRERLWLPRADWVKQLQPLLKLRLLLAAGDALGGDSPGRDASATLTLNLNFSHEQTSIKIYCSKSSAKQPAPGPAAQAQAPSRRDLRCKAYTQALLMRIMKKHKVLHRAELLQELEAQSNGWFSPTPELVRTYIDELVFKEYLEPAPGDSDTYKYLP